MVPSPCHCFHNTTQLRWSHYDRSRKALQASEDVPAASFMLAAKNDSLGCLNGMLRSPNGASVLRRCKKGVQLRTGK